MSVTLEQCMLLIRHHGMSKEALQLVSFMTVPYSYVRSWMMFAPMAYDGAMSGKTLATTGTRSTASRSWPCRACCAHRRAPLAPTRPD